MARATARRGGAWVFDTDAGGDGLLFSDNGSQARIPASNQKLFTTAAFLAELGAEGRLETRVYARGKLSGRGDSVVERRPGHRRRRRPGLRHRATSPAPTTSP